MTRKAFEISVYVTRERKRIPIFDLQSFQQAIGESYAIDRVIGRGGMATVILATDHKHERRVAIKVLNTDASGQSAERFQREIKLLARLQHPNLLPVFDSGVADGRLWYSMPYVEGESLRAKLSRESTIDADTCMSMLGVLADALSYAHSCGVIHRDIKPENILLSHSIPLLADFGIAAALDATPDNKLTETGMAIGTPQYMSPEQAVAERNVDARSDIYSLGCVGFEMLTGRPPFEGSSIHAIVARIIATAVPSIREIRPEISPVIEGVIARAMAKDPAERWQTGAEFSRALSEARTKGFVSGVAGTKRRQQRFLIPAVAAAMVIVGTSATLLLNKSGGRDSVSRSSRHVPDSQAVDAYRRGIARLDQRTQRTLIEGLALIEQAIRIDSLYALAWAGKARAYGWAQTWEYQVPGVPSDSLLSRRLAAIERALDLDSTDAEIWLINAITATAVDPTRRDVTLNSLRRANRLDPLNGRVLIALAINHQEAGTMDSALMYFRKAMNTGYRATGAPGYANHFYWRRQYDSAAVWSDTGIVRSPSNPYAREMAGAAALMLGKLDDAETHYQAAVRLDNGPTRIRGLEGLAEIAAARGDTVTAMKLIADAEKLADPAKPNDHAAISLASAYATVGKNDTAIHWLEKYHPRGDLHFQLHLKRDPELDPLRADKRFAALLVK